MDFELIQKMVRRSFLDEAPKLTSEADRLLGRTDEAALERLYNIVDTMAGSGQMAGFGALARFSQAMHDLVGCLVHGEIAMGPDELKVLRDAGRTLAAFVEGILVDDAFALDTKPVEREIDRCLGREGSTESADSGGGGGFDGGFDDDFGSFMG